MDYKKINEALRDISAIRNKKAVETVKTDEDTTDEVYPSEIEDVFIKLTVTTDSYGDNEKITSIQFVSPVTKNITNYEPIK